MLQCMICDNGIKYRVLAPCNHSDLCLRCYLRSVICYDNHSCVVCTKEYSSFPIVTTNLSSDLTYESAKSQTTHFPLPVFHLYYSDISVLNEIMNYMSFRCYFCKQRFNVFNDVNEIKTANDTLKNRIKLAQDNFSNHVKNSHHHFVCFICLNSNRFLPCEAESFSKRLYEIHKNEMHKKCPCCAFVGFDAHDLELHMNDVHVRCDICIKLYNEVRWFKNEGALIDHYQKEHFVCYHPECLDSLIAFPTQLELLNHLSKVHHEKVDFNGVSLTENKEKLERIRKEEEKERQLRIVECNQKFMKKLKEVFGNDDKKIQNLRSNAVLLINNRISVQDFYKKFCEICGDDKKKVFTDMVAIMPDPEKRAELLRLSENLELNAKSKKVFPKSVSMPSVKKDDVRDDEDEDQKLFIQPEVEQPPPPPQNNQPQSKKKKKPKKMVISDF